MLKTMSKIITVNLIFSLVNQLNLPPIQGRSTLMWITIETVDTDTNLNIMLVVVVPHTQQQMWMMWQDLTKMKSRHKFRHMRNCSENIRESRMLRTDMEVAAAVIIKLMSMYQIRTRQSQSREMSSTMHTTSLQGLITDLISSQQMCKVAVNQAHNCLNPKKKNQVPHRKKKMTSLTSTSAALNHRNNKTHPLKNRCHPSNHLQ